MSRLKLASLTTAGSLLLGFSSCAVKKDYVEIPTDQMPSKHKHAPIESDSISYITSGNKKSSIENIKEQLKLVYFDFDSAELKSSERKKVVNIAQSLKKISPDTTLVIVGHTDQLGPDKYNKMLGLERAKSVRDVLLNEGVDPAMLKIKSYGEKNPKVMTSDLAEMDMNRRVDFKI